MIVQFAQVRTALTSMLLAWHSQSPMSADGPPCIAPVENIKSSVVIRDPGNYCLDRNVNVEGWYNWVLLGGHGKSHYSRSNYALVVATGDVVIDLKGKTIYTDAKDVLAGLLASANKSPLKQSGLIPVPRTKDDWERAPKNITIKNGTIDLRWASHVTTHGQLGVLVSSGVEWFAHSISPGAMNHDVVDSLFGNPIGSPRFKYLPKTYPQRNITLENLKIRSPGFGIVLQGAGSRIINCEIETDSSVAIWSFGPGAVIEGNTVRANRNKRLSKWALPSHAPIVVQDGAGSVVRNNKIYQGKSEQSISIVNSADVTVKDNRAGGWFSSDVVVRQFETPVSAGKPAR